MGTTTKKSYRILIVEDDADFTSTTKEILESQGYIVECAGSGEEARDIFQKTEFDLALVDLKLPDITGEDLVTEIKQKSSRTEVLVITGYGSSSSAVSCLEKGAYSYITKPVDPAFLLCAIKRIRERQDLLRERERMVDNLSAINTVLGLISRILEFEVLIDRVMEKIVDVTGFDFGAFQLFEEPTGRVRNLNLQGVPDDLAKALFREGEPQGLAAAVLEGRESVLIGPGLSEDKRIDTGLLKAFGIGTLLAIPVEALDHIQGVLSIGTFRNRPISPNDVYLLRSISKHVGMALGNSILHKLVSESERQYRAFFETVPIGIVLADGKSQILECNPVASSMLGCPSSACRGESFWEHLDAESRTQITRGIWQDFADYGHSLFEGVLTSRDGETRQVMGNATLLDNDRILITVQDITEDRRLREMLYQSEKLSALGTLISGIAHEVNNPLTTVIGFTRLLMESDAAEDITDDLKRIHNAAEMIREVMERLLNFARPAKLEKKAVDINQLLREVVSLRSYSLKTSGVKVTEELDTAIPKMVADPAQLKQVFLNIIINAENALKEVSWEREITIRTRRASTLRAGEKRREIARVEISDTGPGMSEDLTRRIFEPFFTTTATGSGLGLSVALRIVEEHQGTITATSEPGTGATFLIEIPVTEAETAEAVPEIEKPFKASGEKILVVDDEEDIVDYVKIALGRRGFNITGAYTPEEVRSRLESEQLDAVIADMKMGSVTGKEIYEEVKRVVPGLEKRFLLMTGDILSPDTRAFIEETGIPYIAKPFTIQDLASSVRSLLGI